MGPKVEELAMNAAPEVERPVDYSAGPPGARPVGGRAATGDRVPGIVIMGFIASLAALLLALVAGFLLMITTMERVVPAGITLIFSGLGIALMGVAIGLNVASIRFLDRHPAEEGRALAFWGFSLSLVGVVVFLVLAFVAVITMFVD